MSHKRQLAFPVRQFTYLYFLNNEAGLVWRFWPEIYRFLWSYSELFRQTHQKLPIAKQSSHWTVPLRIVGERVAIENCANKTKERSSVWLSLERPVWPLFILLQAFFLPRHLTNTEFSHTVEKRVSSYWAARQEQITSPEPRENHIKKINNKRQKKQTNVCCSEIIKKTFLFPKRNDVSVVWKLSVSLSSSPACNGEESYLPAKPLVSTRGKKMENNI